MKDEPFVVPLPEDGSARQAPAPEILPMDEVMAVPVGEETAPVPDEAALAPRRRWGAVGLRILWSAALGFALLWLGDWAVSTAHRLLLEEGWVGWLATALLVLCGLGFAIWAGWELAALRRLRTVEATRSLVRAGVGGDAASAQAAIADMRALHPGEAGLFRRLDAERDAVRDPADLMALLEATVQRPVDAACRAAIGATARRTALVTAVSPFAILDMLVTMGLNLRMLRRIAEIQGCRPGFFATLALVRRTITALLIAGGVEALDDYIGAFAGAGVLRSLGKRAGEGVVNGLMTIRIGIAAMKVCRPLPYLRDEPPKMLAVAREVFR